MGTGTMMYSCKSDNKAAGAQSNQQFEVECDRFADLEVLRYEIHGFETLTPQQKELAYYLYEAANAGRDIIYDQKYKHNLTIRKTLEAIIETHGVAQQSEDWNKLLVYAKRVFFSNGIHHHYSNLKFVPECSYEYFADLVKNTDPNKLPLNGKTIDAFLAEMKPVIFDPKVDAKMWTYHPTLIT